MKFGFRFSNLCGGVYRQGNVVFTPDGNTLLSPCGNRVTSFDLVNNVTRTFPFQTRKNVSRLVLSNSGILLLAIDEEGHSLLVNVPRETVLAHINLRERVVAAQFSPNDHYVAISHKTRVKIWRTPVSAERQFAPLTQVRELAGATGDVKTLEWSPDSRFVMVGTGDSATKIYSLPVLHGYAPVTFAGHRYPIVGCHFNEDATQAWTICARGAVCIWKRDPAPAVRSGTIDSSLPESEQRALRVPAAVKGGWNKHWRTQKRLRTAIQHATRHAVETGQTKMLRKIKRDHDLQDMLLGRKKRGATTQGTATTEATAEMEIEAPKEENLEENAEETRPATGGEDTVGTEDAEQADDESESSSESESDEEEEEEGI
eukprot:gnl/Trimastix_PCT/1776.p1 GENE.gnl/Trimastix_PCT/1776~~gnl/Trimastix_PCT/1776.p1  ORF type:complete len:393 (-),score=116.13 gnl/Trimastix_PCT/1776:17-1135(-)